MLAPCWTFEVSLYLGHLLLPLCVSRLPILGIILPKFLLTALLATFPCLNRFVFRLLIVSGVSYHLLWYILWSFHINLEIFACNPCTALVWCFYHWCFYHRSQSILYDTSLILDFRILTPQWHLTVFLDVFDLRLPLLDGLTNLAHFLLVLCTGLFPAQPALENYSFPDL